jgi:DNA invertase Pin-like site-specific DNA recombinase
MGAGAVASSVTKQIRRCAIYTRKSSEEGLEQDFNSLHAQRESCEAYINSQKHEGWIAVPAVYDDGGYSGGSMERPALKQLLADIKSGSVDVVVVYKVDRLTRSLSDFARIVEVFDLAGASFVSVTQQFNTTTSMGRLTLNVLLSFAQFEREVTGERIRDKIAASKKKGMWMGGWVPLGFDRKDRTLTINQAEAKTVRAIFDLFLNLKNVREVQKELARLKLRTKHYSVQRGRAVGGLPFARGHIYKILSNPIYRGEITHKGVNHPGQHPGLISQKTWDAVQTQLAANNHANRSRSNAKSTSLLAGLIFDANNNRLVSSHATKNGKRYRYYISSDGAGRTAPGSDAAKVRISAAQIDDLVLSTLSRFLNDKQKIAKLVRKHRSRTADLESALEVASHLADVLGSESSNRKRELVAGLLSRVTVAEAGITISIIAKQLRALLSNTSEPSGSNGSEPDIVLEAQFIASNRDKATKLLIEQPGGLPSGPDPVVVKAVARAQGWFEQLITGKAVSMAQIATRENVTDNYVSNLIHLAWLPPHQIDLILEGDPGATQLAKHSMLTRNVDIIWRDPERSAG